MNGFLIDGEEDAGDDGDILDTGDSLSYEAGAGARSLLFSGRGQHTATGTSCHRIPLRC
jgi:hypothetical protein